MDKDIKESIKSLKNQIAKLGYNDLGAKNSQRSSRNYSSSSTSNYSTEPAIRPIPPPRPPPPKSLSSQVNSSSFSNVPNNPTVSVNQSSRVVPLIINPKTSQFKTPVSQQSTATTTSPVPNPSSSPQTARNTSQHSPPIIEKSLLVSPAPESKSSIAYNTSGSLPRPPIPHKHPSLRTKPIVSGNPPSRPHEQQQNKNPSVDSVIREFRGTFSTLSSQLREVTGTSKRNGRVYSQSELSTQCPTGPSNINNNYSPTGTSNAREDCLECQDFNLVDAHAKNFPRHTVWSIANLAYDLCSPFQSKIDRARAIFIWLHHNVSYDTTAYFSNSIKHKTPDETLRTGLAVCEGYATLFSALGSFCGLEAIVVSGHGKGIGHRQNMDGFVPSFKSNHAWNAVKLDTGKWHLIDACWGAGYVDSSNCYQKHLTTKYFTSSPEIFRLRHFPTNPGYQFCSSNLSWEEYIMMKDGPLLYTPFDDKGFSDVTIQPHTRIIHPGPTKFVITTKCKHTCIHPRDQEVLLLDVDGILTAFEVDSFGTSWTCESWAIKYGSQVSVSFLNKLGDQSGKGVSVQEYLRSKGRVSMSWVSLCKWET